MGAKRVLAVRWNDTVCQRGWERRGVWPHLDPVVSVGLVIHEDADTITLASTWCLEDGDTHQRITIPRGMIRSKRVIRDPWRKKGK